MVFLALGAAPEALARAAHERPLPAFEGTTLDGDRISISDYIGKRLVLVFFNPEVPEAEPAVRAVAAVAALATSHNFEVVGVTVGSSRPTTRRFVEAQQVGFPVIDDVSGSITRRLGLRSPATIVAADAEGYLIYGTANFNPQEPDETQRVEDALREALRLPERNPSELAFGERPRAQDFETVRLAGGEPFRLADHAGRPVVLIFFLHTCPHCHAALEALLPLIEKVPSAKRPLLVAISTLDQPPAVREMLKERNLDIPVVLLDPGRKVQTLYGLGGGVPDVFFLDSDHRVVHRVMGWREKRDPALARMVIAKISSEKIPYLLNPKGYTGSEVCGVCHELELESWHYTKHAAAFDTLVTHGADRNPECVSCHVVGFDQPGGYTIDAAPAHLEDVSCENCHGRGGPHLSKGFVANGNYAPVCVTCHNATHSLGFEYSSFRKNVSHTGIAAMTAEQRAALGGARPGNLMPTGAAYVGSDACGSCHPKEFASWSAGPHAQAVETLKAKGKADSAECLACHTTAFDLPGGFSPKASPADHPDLARVGCESCHGPGEAHVAKDASRIGTIISLGDKCDSCVILQICGSCHDDANDPGFAFEVVDKIERQRHGTIEAGTGKPLPAASLPDEDDRQLAGDVRGQPGD
jgi:peroxiredoxin